jgi:demethylmenaquinone methyltransferase/2-methoxy-6-polyprenyl-1,4-benzoquinol methylase
MKRNKARVIDDRRQIAADRLGSQERRGPDPVADRPDASLALERYRRHADAYDETARRSMPARMKTIEKLALTPGDAVLDVGCGTGLSFVPLIDRIGPGGRLVGVELSPEMIARARLRCEHAGWGNVSLIESAIEAAPLAGPFDAVLFHCAHDVLRSPAALERIFASLAPGARVAAAGMKLGPWWAAPLNPLVRRRARPYMTTFEGLAEPWSLLVGYLDDFRWQSRNLGSGWIGWGHARVR